MITWENASGQSELTILDGRGRFFTSTLSANIKPALELKNASVRGLAVALAYQPETETIGLVTSKMQFADNGSFLVFNKAMSIEFQTIALSHQEYGMSIISVTTSNGANAVYVVGTRGPNDDGGLTIYHKVHKAFKSTGTFTWLSKKPNVLSSYNGKLLVSTASTLRLYTVNLNELIQEASYDHTSNIKHVKCESNRILICGDDFNIAIVEMIDGIFIPTTSTSKARRADFCKSVGVITCSLSGSLKIFKCSEENRLQMKGFLRTNQTISVFCRKLSSASNIESEVEILGGTVNGSVFYLAILDPYTWKVLDQLQTRLSAFVKSAENNNIKYIHNCSPSITNDIVDSIGIIDGGLLELFLALSSDQAEHVLKDFSVDGSVLDSKGQTFTVNYFIDLLMDSDFKQIKSIYI